MPCPALPCPALPCLGFPGARSWTASSKASSSSGRPISSTRARRRRPPHGRTPTTRTARRPGQTGCYAGDTHPRDTHPCPSSNHSSGLPSSCSCSSASASASNKRRWPDSPRTVQMRSPQAAARAQHQAGRLRRLLQGRLLRPRPCLRNLRLRRFAHPDGRQLPPVTRRTPPRHLGTHFFVNTNGRQLRRRLSCARRVPLQSSA